MLLMWFAKSIALQLLSRLLEGAATSMAWIVGMTIIVDTVTVKHAGEYMGHVAIALNAATFVGPFLGGVVFDQAGYNAVWGTIFGFVGLSTLLRSLMVEQGARMRMARLGSEASSMYSELGLATSFSDNHMHSLRNDDQGGSLPVTNIEPQVQSQEANSSSTRSRLPVLLKLTLSMRMIVALLGVCVQAMIFTGFETVLALYVQEIFGYGPFEAGLMFIPLTVPSFFAPLLGRIIDRTTPRWALVLGFLWLCPVLVVTRFVTYNSIGQKVLMCSLLTLIGLGLTAVLNPLMAEISYVAEERGDINVSGPGKSGNGDSKAFAQAYAVFLMAYSTGDVVGPLLAGLIRDRVGWGTMCLVLGLVSGMAAIPCFVWSGTGQRRRPLDSGTTAGRTEEAHQSRGSRTE